LSLGYKIQLGFGLLFLWMVVGFFVGIPWAIILGFLGGENLALVEAGHVPGGFFANVGMLQGIIGGIYHFGMIFGRGVTKPLSKSQALHDGFLVSIPGVALLLLWSDVKWTLLGLFFFPIAGLICSRCATYVVNHDIAGETLSRT